MVDWIDAYLKEWADDKNAQFRLEAIRMWDGEGHYKQFLRDMFIYQWVVLLMSN